MTDEEIGRKWCEKNGKRPWRPDGDMWRWTTHPDALLPHCLTEHVLNWDSPELLPRAWHSESEAYAALGNTIRRVCQFTDDARKVVGE